METRIVAIHVPGSLNIQADFLSRGGALHHEWELNAVYLNLVFEEWRILEIDVFACKATQNVSYSV